MAKILMIIAPENFRDEEYFEPKKVFEDEGFSVTTASKITGEIKGMLGKTAVSDLALQMVDPEEYDAAVLVGGIGAKEYFEDEYVHSLLRKFSENSSKIVGAICISPNTLANAGLLEGRKATVWNDDELIANLKEKGANYTSLDITIDGNIITASGPKAAKEFGREMVNLIKGRRD